MLTRKGYMNRYNLMDSYLETQERYAVKHNNWKWDNLIQSYLVHGCEIKNYRQRERRTQR